VLPDGLPICRWSLSGPHDRERAKQKIRDIKVNLSTCSCTDCHDARAPAGGFKCIEQRLTAHKIQHYVETISRGGFQCPYIVSASQGDYFIGKALLLKLRKGTL
jgi:hypothetical protein